jgi:hypothetical protein
MITFDVGTPAAAAMAAINASLTPPVLFWKASAVMFRVNVA